MNFGQQQRIKIFNFFDEVSNKKQEFNDFLRKIYIDVSNTDYTAFHHISTIKKFYKRL